MLMLMIFAVGQKGEPMRARLNKQQAKMLLEGKCLTFGHSRIAIPKGDSDIRMILEDFANSGEVMSKYDVFVNVGKRCFEIEERRTDGCR